MNRAIKVFGWTSRWNDPRIKGVHKQVRCICAASSMAEIEDAHYQCLDDRDAEDAKAAFTELQSQRQLLKRMAEALEAVTDHFDMDFEDPGHEIYGLVNGKEMTAGGKQLNRVLENARAVLAEYREAVKSGRAGGEG